MSDDGVQLQLKGTTFRFEFLQILGSVLEAGAKSLLAIKSGGALLALAPNAISGLFGAFKGFKSEESLELRAWLLVSGGLAYALEQAISETVLKEEPPPEALRKLIDDIGVRIETRVYTIEPDFFTHPNRLELLDDVSHELSAWGYKFGGRDKPADARAKVDRYFSTGLHRAWMRDARRFEPLEQALNSPFVSSAKVQREFDGYLQYLEEQFTELRLIGQDEDNPAAVKLAQVFVPLRAYVEIASDTNKKMTPQEAEGIGPPESESRNKRRVVHCFEALDQWVRSANRKDPLRILSGGPGIGKSSSLRAYAARIARSGIAYPIFVPLQKLAKPDQPLRDRIHDYLTSVREIPLTSSPLDLVQGRVAGRPFLIIFDGLDELVRPGRDADDIAREFMVDLRGLLDQENGQQGSTPARVVAIVAGRVAAAGSAARALKCSGEQVLFLLGFAQQKETAEDEYEDPEDLLSEDQRLTWWALWYAASKGVPDKIPDQLLHTDLDEVTVEPLLLYFVALIKPWETDQEKGEFGRNHVYGRLLRYFYDRECSKGDRNFATEFQVFGEYEVVLQAMALAAWYDGSTRIGTIDVVNKLLRDWDPDIANSFRNVIGSNKPAISAALAFYMRPHESPNSFEFMHKTFAEYLVARRIVEAVALISGAFDDSKLVRAGRRKPFDATTCLKDWLRLTGPRPLDFDLLRFLQDEIASCYSSSISKVLDWRDALVTCMQAALLEGMPAHLLVQLPDDQIVRRPQTFRNVTEQARNAEEALLAALNASILPSLNERDFTPVDVRPPSHDGTMLGNMIHRLRGQRVGPYAVSLRVLSGLSFQGEQLYFQDLYGMTADNADFSAAVLIRSIVQGAKLRATSFAGARLQEADFSGADLGGADFTDAELQGINLDNVDIDQIKIAKSDRVKLKRQTSLRQIAKKKRN
jgi:uncharacterized protein YjbI with pentapeptide repeats